MNCRQSQLSFFASTTPTTPTPTPTSPTPTTSRGFGGGFLGALAGVPGSPVQTAVCGGGFFVAELAGQNPDGSLCSSCIQSCLLEVGDFLGNQLQLRNLAHRKKLICIRIQLRLQLRNLACRKKLICLRNRLQPRNLAHRKKFIRLGI